MMDISQKYLFRFISLAPKHHLAIGFAIRLLLIAFSEFMDKVSNVQYTDVDYLVFTDAARYVYDFKSPYERHTYRYSPLLAIFLIPNIIIHRTFGKIIFSLIDVIVGLLIFRIVVVYMKNTTITNHKKELEENSNLYGKYSMLLWIYNPMSIIIATRGNADSIAAFFVLTTLYYIYVKRDYYKAGIFHGLACHFRIYPIIFSLALFMHLSDFSTSLNLTKKRVTSMVKRNPEERRTIFKKKYLYYLIPNVDQLKLIIGAAWVVLSLTLVFYFLYGYEFLYETYLYHLVRKDTRHNFSVYFYIQYLTADIKNLGIFHKLLTVLPNLVLLTVFGIRYGLHKDCLFFAVFAQAVTLVVYNTVITSQYFIWFLSILPLIVWHCRLSVMDWVKLFAMWMAGQSAWLVAAYYLEFKGVNTFIFVWWQSMGLFSASIIIFNRIIKSFSPLIVDKSD